jgi:hypothetical protein
MPAENVISLGAGRGQLELINQLSKFFNVIGIDRDRKAIGFKNCKYKIFKSTFDYQDIFDELKKKKLKYSFVLCRSSGKALLTQSLLLKDIKKKSIDPKSVIEIINKKKFVRKLKSYKIKTPEIINKKNIKNYKKKFVIKPTRIDISRLGVFFMNNTNSLSEKIKFYQKNLIKDYLYNQYISGKDLIFCSIIKNRQIHKICNLEEINYLNKKSEIKRFAFLSYKASKKILKKVNKITKKILKIFKIENSPLMLQFRECNGNLYLIEIHIELWGDLIIEKIIGKENFKSILLFITNKKNKFNLKNINRNILFFDKKNANKTKLEIIKIFDENKKKNSFFGL